MKWIRHIYKIHITTVRLNFIHWFIFGESSNKASTPTSQDSKAAQSVSQIQRQKRNKSEQFSASRIVKGLVAHTSPFSGRRGNPDYSYRASTVWFHWDEGLLLRDNLNGLWLTDRRREGYDEGGEWPLRSTTATFDNDDSEWKDGWLGFVEWYYLFGPFWKGRQWQSPIVQVKFSFF